MTRRRPTRPAPTEPQRVVAYRRVSTDEQADSGLGLDAQYADIRAAVEQRGWLLVADIAEVASGSTAFPDRDGGVQALLMLDAGEADVLMVAKQDRLSGSIEAPVLRAYAKRMRWQVHALDDGDTTEPDGDMVSNIRAVFALYRRKKMAQRTKVALAVLAKTAHVGRRFEMDAAEERVPRLVVARLEHPYLVGLVPDAWRDRQPPQRGRHPSVTRWHLDAGHHSGRRPPGRRPQVARGGLEEEGQADPTVLDGR